MNPKRIGKIQINGSDEIAKLPPICSVAFLLTMGFKHR